MARPPDDGSRIEQIAGILSKGPLPFESLATTIGTSPKEVAERWDEIAPLLDVGMRRTWEPLIKHWRAMELGIGKEEYLAEQARREELAAALWSRVLDPATHQAARRLLADGEKGLLAGYEGPVLDFQEFVALPKSDDVTIPQGMRTAEVPELPGMRVVLDPLFPPISMLYRALHKSWKVYRLRELIAQRLRLLVELSPRIESGVRDADMSDLVGRAGLNETFQRVVLSALGLEWTKEKNDPEAWARDMALLFAAESMTGNALRAILLAEGPLPQGAVREHEALLLELYGVLR